MSPMIFTAVVSRPRRLADCGSPGDAPPAGDWETTAVNIFLGVPQVDKRFRAAFPGFLER